MEGKKETRKVISSTNVKKGEGDVNKIKWNKQC